MVRFRSLKIFSLMKSKTKGNLARLTRAQGRARRRARNEKGARRERETKREKNNARKMR